MIHALQELALVFVKEQKTYCPHEGLLSKMALGWGRFLWDKWHRHERSAEPIFDSSVKNGYFLSLVGLIRIRERKYLIPDFPGESCECNHAAEIHVARVVRIDTWKWLIGIQGLRRHLS